MFAMKQAAGAQCSFYNFNKKCFIEINILTSKLLVLKSEPGNSVNGISESSINVHINDKVNKMHSVCLFRICITFRCSLFFLSRSLSTFQHVSRRINTVNAFNYVRMLNATFQLKVYAVKLHIKWLYCIK